VYLIVELLLLLEHLLNLFIVIFVDQDNEEFLTNISKKMDKINMKGKKHKKCLRDKTAPRPPHSGKIIHFFRKNIKD